MKIAIARVAAIAALAMCIAAHAAEPPPSPPLPAPRFHHLHLNSVDPDAAIAFYQREFPSTVKTEWGGLPALASPDDVLVLFTRVATPPDADPEATAYWHFGWTVPDVRKRLALYTSQPGLAVAPLYTGYGDGSVLVNSDTWPGVNGLPGLTQQQIADAKARGVKPSGGPGFFYLRGPDNALIEISGDLPSERFNHVHMYEEDPFCAELWYRTHLNAGVSPLSVPVLPHTEADCKTPRGPERSWPALMRQGMFRVPQAGVMFGGVAMNWYMRQTEKPLVGSQGHLIDHIGLSVGNLDAWIAKLRREGVTFLKQPYRLGGARAIMIEGPSHEAIELLEVR